MEALNTKIIQNKQIASDVFELTVSAPHLANSKPGQFAQIRVPSFFLRRPFAISKILNSHVSFAYKIVGNGTKKLTTIKPNSKLNVLGPLGKGYPVLREKRLLVIGGGVGVGPLLLAVTQLSIENQISVRLGFSNKESIFYEQEFAKSASNLQIYTDDGSFGTKGFPLYPVNNDYDFYLTCGSFQMQKAIAEKFAIPGYVSIESHMACGFGACNGCTIRTAQNEVRKICSDGPVFAAQEICW